MNLSVFDIFKIGIGPSSSHTMGPMNAARDFVEILSARDLLTRTAQVSAQLYGSLALTGRGHCTDRAILLGLEGMSPESIDSGVVEPALQRIRNTKRLRLANSHEIDFDEPLNLLFHTDQVLPGHSNGMRFSAHDAAQKLLAREEYYSIGGGFVIRAGAEMNAGAIRRPPPFEFGSGEQLLELGKAQGLEIHELMMARERTWRSEAEVHAGLLRIVRRLASVELSMKRQEVVWLAKLYLRRCFNRQPVCRHPPLQSPRIILCLSWTANLMRCSMRLKMRSRTMGKRAPKQWSACRCFVRRWM